MKSSISTKYLCTFITITSVFFMVLSLYWTEPAVSLLNVIPPLPISFFIGLAFLTAAASILWIFREECIWFHILHLTLLIFYLSFLPQLIWGLDIGYYNPYIFWRDTDYIIREGFLNQQIATYHNWPATFILLTTLAKVTGVAEPYSFITFSHMLLQYLLILPLILFLKNLTVGNRISCIVGVWLFLMGSWVQIELAPQTFGFFFLLLILALLTKTSSNDTFSLHICTILVIASLISTHLLSSLAGLFFVLAYCISKKKLNLAIINAVLIIVWMIFVTSQFFSYTFSYYITTAFNLDLLFQKGLVTRLGYSEMHQRVAYVKLTDLLMISSIGLTGAFITLNKKERKIPANRTALLLSLGLLLTAVVVGPSYAREGPDRLFLLSLPLITFFGTKLIGGRLRIILFISIFLLSPLHIMSYYSTIAAGERLSMVYIQGIYDFGEHVTQGIYISTWPLEKYNESFSYIPLEELYLSNKLPETSPQYFLLSSNDEKFFSYWYNDPSFIEKLKILLNNNFYDITYTNRNLVAYYKS